MIETISMPLPVGLDRLYPLLRARAARTPFAILDSGWEPRPQRHPRLAQRSFIACEPFAVLRAWGDHAVLEGESGVCETGATFDLLRATLRRFALAGEETPTPFPAGAIGYLGYGLKALVEPVENSLPADQNLPDLWLALFDAAITVELGTGTLHITSTGLPAEGPARRRRARQRAGQLREWLQQIPCADRSPAGISPAPARVALQGFPASSFTHADYLKAVRRIKDYIAAGDIYQANLSQRFQTPFDGDGLSLFLHLRTRNPAPFAAFLEGIDFQVVSASPERFLHLDPATGRIQTRPIKGTRRRGSTPDEDRVLAEELMHSVKDRAEHLMIVDLERNDLGRVAEIGSVAVPEFSVLEPFATVFHLTSTVEATLRRDRDRVDLLRATFPGGSITGAPKIRAMQIIEETETVRRGVYTGAMGYLSFTGAMDLNIAIRTITIQDGTACFHVGGGIVADSDPQGEYEETLAKGAALAEVLSRR